MGIHCFVNCLTCHTPFCAHLMSLSACSLLLPTNVQHGAVAACGLGVLTAHTDAPIVPQAPVQAHTLHALQILTQRLVQEIGVLLGGLAVLHVALAIEHPSRDLELKRVADDGNNLVHLV